MPPAPRAITCTPTRPTTLHVGRSEWALGRRVRRRGAAGSGLPLLLLVPGTPGRRGPAHRRRLQRRGLAHRRGWVLGVGLCHRRLCAGWRLLESCLCAERPAAAVWRGCGYRRRDTASLTGQLYRRCRKGSRYWRWVGGDRSVRHGAERRAGGRVHEQSPTHLSHPGWVRADV